MQMEPSDNYKNCTLCPRRCRVDRTNGQIGFCRQSDRMVLACATRHFGEEPPLVGQGGSGALFFSGCTLRCGFCQNRQLSRSEVGRGISREEFVRICLELQEGGAENINLVSATPFIPSLEAGISEARRKGLHLPVVWNSSGYELPETVDRLAEFVDVFLPDLKLLDPELSGRLFAAGDYPERAAAALKRMAEHKVGRKPNTIVRHLVLPGLLQETRRVLEWFARELGDRALFSLMVQFAVPEEGLSNGGGPQESGSQHGSLQHEGPQKEPKKIGSWRRGVGALENRPLTPKEYDMLLQWLDELEIEEGLIQEPGEDGLWWPDFNRTNPFPSEYSRVVWSCREGFAAH